MANVITYRTKSAVRDMAKALGAAPGQQDAWSKQVDRWGPVAATAGQPDITIPAAVLELAAQVEHFPRHLGIHSGGMVLCDRPVIEVCPVEWGRMDDRSVLQWDKDDCAAAGLVKFDLLGLGMLSALHYAVDLIREHRGYELDLAALDSTDQEVYDMLCRADSVGVFQVESRAQMATLPRLEPRTFYDLVVEVALIRPGPIQGGSVHPYIRRRNGQEPVTYPHPLLETVPGQDPRRPAVPGAAHADGHRRRRLHARARPTSCARPWARSGHGSGWSGCGPGSSRAWPSGASPATTAEEIWEKLAAFANYGFPESHSVSFAYLVYASSWIKRYEPAAFCAALLNAQPMGFYSPHSLVQDARRHGVEVRSPDVNASADDRHPRAAARATRSTGGPTTAPGRPPARWGVGGPAVRLGIGSVRGIGDDLAERIAAGRPYVDMEDLVPAHRRHRGAARGAGHRRRLRLLRRSTGARRCGRPGRWPSPGPAGWPAWSPGPRRPPLPGMEPCEEASPTCGPPACRPRATPPASSASTSTAWACARPPGLAAAPEGKVTVAGVVTHRQRPATAGGTLFVNLEDETGLINVVVSKGCWARHRRVARAAPAMLVRGRLERAEGVINVIAERMEALPLGATTRSRDFR